MDQETQINDPYFRKIDALVRQSHAELNSKSRVINSELKNQGKLMLYRTIYTSTGRTYHSFAEIDR